MGGQAVGKLGAVARDRWATFDCYGTLIDWNAGIRGQLARVFGEGRADELLERYHELELELEADGQLSYRGVLTEAQTYPQLNPAGSSTLTVPVTLTRQN